MTGPEAQIPPDIDALASERAEARRARDFARADELRARIEAAGWRVVDVGTGYTVAPARPADRRVDGRVVFGAPASVPSRLGEPAAAGLTGVVVAGDGEATAVTARGLRVSSEAPCDIVVVAAEGSVDRTALLEGLRDAVGVEPVEVAADGVVGPPGAWLLEVLWMSPELGPGGLVAGALRRSGRELVVLVEAGASPGGALVAPLAPALGDETVAAVGIEGLTSADLHRFSPAEPDGPISALGPTLLAFRRSDIPLVGDVDERLTSYAGVVTWMSLGLRVAEDEGEPRRLVVVDAPIARGDRQDAIARRDRYRIAAAFADHPELAAARGRTAG